MDQKLFTIINQLAGKNTLADSLMIFSSSKIRYIFAFVLFFMLLCKRSKYVFYHSVIVIMITSCIKLLFNHIKFKPRPFMERKVNLLIPSKSDSTFISKHTILTFAVSTTVYMYNKMIGFILLWMSILTGFSRIWTGAHYPFDIVRSGVIGSLVSIVVNRFSRLDNRKKQGWF